MKEIFILVLMFTLSGCWETETGEKIGNIVKLGKQGAFIKTNEAELIRGGMSDGSGSFGREFDFTIENESLLPIIKQSMEEQKPVRIKYHKEFATWLRTQTHDNSFLDAVEIIK
jgi:hypothetical protein